MGSIGRNIWEKFINTYPLLFRTNEEHWYDTLNEIEDYIKKHNHLPSSYDKDKNVKILGNWINTQKKQYKENIYIMKEQIIRKDFEEFMNTYQLLFNKYLNH